MRRRIRLPAILALATLSCGLAACGAVEPASDRGAEVQRASERTSRVRTARFEIRYVERDGADETAGTCEGAVSYPDKRYRFLCRLADSDMGPSEIELVSVGGATFVRYTGSEAPFADPDKPWVRLDLGMGDAEDDVLELIDPVALLELLRSATVKTEHLGAERVRGVATERFRLTIDRRRAEALGGGDDDGPETFPVDVWVGDGLIRRMRAEDPPGSSGTFEFFDFGTPVDIEAPPTDRVAEVGEGETDYEPAPCPGGPTTAPLTVETVTRVLGEHGIALKPLGSGCGGPRDVVIALTNGGSDEAGSDDSRGEEGIVPSEGLVTCNLYAEPLGGARTTLRTNPDDGVTRFELANLQCMRFVPDDVPGFDLDALEDGLRALESTLR